MVKVSIIVPVFNGESYLKKCLDSLVNQTLNDIEIIVINDGSKDKTIDILKYYETKYPNIVKVINQENQGIAKARNKGLKVASGEYIGFVDSDDFVDVSMYEKLYQKAKTLDFDIVSSYFNFTYDDKKELGVVDLLNDIKTSDDLKQYLVNLYPVIWNKIYKSSIILNEEFKSVYAEDVEFLYRILPKVSKIGIVCEPLYNYYQREKSESKVFDKRLFDYVTNFNFLYDYYKKNKYLDKYYLEFEYVYVRYLYATFLKRATTFNKELFDDAYLTASLNVKKYFPNYKKNKYFYKSLKGIYLLTFNKLYAIIMFKAKKR